MWIIFLRELDWNNLKKILIIPFLLSMLFFGCPKNNPSSESSKAETVPIVTFDKKIGGQYSGPNPLFSTTNDGGFIVVSRSQRLPFSIQLLKLNSSGNIEWSKIYEQFSFPLTITVLSDGGYLIVSYFLDYSKRIIRSGINGDTIWTKILNDSLIITDNNFIETSDRGFFAFGQTNVNSNVVRTLIKFNSDGTLVSVIESPKLGLYPGGSAPFLFKNNNFETILISSSNIGIALTKINLSGTVLVDNVVSTEIKGVSEIYNAFQNIDGGYFICGKYSGAEGDYGYFLLKTNTDGEKIWIKKYSRTLPDNLPISFLPKNVCETKNGEYFMVGEGSSFPAQMNISKTILAKYSLLGDTLGFNYYPEPSDANSLEWKKIQSTSDGGMVIFGSYSSKDSTINANGTIWLIKTKEDGSY